MVSTPPKKSLSTRGEKRIGFPARLPVDVFNQLKPLKKHGRYRSRNEAVVDSVRRNIKRVVKT